MTLVIRLEGDGAEEELRSLYNWLRTDPDLRRSTQVTLQSASAQPGEMGATIDAIQLVLGTGTGIGGLIFNYLQWRETRTKKPTATIESGGTKRELPETASSEEIKELGKDIADDQP